VKNKSEAVRAKAAEGWQSAAAGLEQQHGPARRVECDSHPMFVCVRAFMQAKISLRMVVGGYWPWVWRWSSL